MGQTIVELSGKSFISIHTVVWQSVWRVLIVQVVTGLPGEEVVTVPTIIEVGEGVITIKRIVGLSRECQAIATF